MRFQYLSAAVCLITLLSLGCGNSNDAANSSSPSSPPSATSAETTTVAQVDSETTSQPIQDTGLRPDPNYPVPDQPAEQLLGFINHLATIPARGETEDEFIADQAGRARSRLFAADRIILTKGITEDLLEAGVRAKLDALRTLALLEPQGLGQDFPEVHCSVVRRGLRKIRSARQA